MIKEVQCLGNVATRMNRMILIVDDDKSIRDSFESALKDFGCEVYLARNGAKAIDILTQKKEIDLIFLDLKLFSINGIGLCRQIRKSKPIAIINAITGWPGLFEVEECREAGWVRFWIDKLKKRLAIFRHNSL